MKKLFISIFILSLFSFGIHQTAGQESSSLNNYVVLTKKVPQLKPILLTAEALKAEDAEKYGDFQVIICGQTVEMLTNEEVMKDFIQQAEHLGVRLNACGFSLKKFGVDTDNLPAGIHIVPNGILYDLQLQKKGYMSLGL